jgi:hypothetical protein
MPTPTTTDDTIRVSELQIDFLYRAALLQMRPLVSQQFIDCLVPWDLSNLYLQAASVLLGRHLSCERVKGPRGEDLAYITGRV